MKQNLSRAKNRARVFPFNCKFVRIEERPSNISENPAYFFFFLGVYLNKVNVMIKAQNCDHINKGGKNPSRSLLFADIGTRTKTGAVNPLPPSDAVRQQKKIFLRIFSVLYCLNL